MPRFFFDLWDTGEVYHDAQGTLLLGPESAKERALEMVRKLVAGPPPSRYCDVVCTVRDFEGTQIMLIRIEFGTYAGPFEISN